MQMAQAVPTPAEKNQLLLASLPRLLESYPHVAQKIADIVASSDPSLAAIIGRTSVGEPVPAVSTVDDNQSPLSTRLQQEDSSLLAPSDLRPDTINLARSSSKAGEEDKEWDDDDETEEPERATTRQNAQSRSVNASSRPAQPQAPPNASLPPQHYPSAPSGSGGPSSGIPFPFAAPSPNPGQVVYFQDATGQFYTTVWQQPFVVAPTTPPQLPPHQASQPSFAFVQAQSAATSPSNPSLQESQGPVAHSTEKFKAPQQAHLRRVRDTAHFNVVPADFRPWVEQIIATIAHNDDDLKKRLRDLPWRTGAPKSPNLSSKWCWAILAELALDSGLDQCAVELASKKDPDHAAIKKTLNEEIEQLRQCLKEAGYKSDANFKIRDRQPTSLSVVALIVAIIELLKRSSLRAAPAIVQEFVRDEYNNIASNRFASLGPMELVFARPDDSTHWHELIKVWASLKYSDGALSTDMMNTLASANDVNNFFKTLEHYCNFDQQDASTLFLLLKLRDQQEFPAICRAILAFQVDNGKRPCLKRVTAYELLHVASKARAEMRLFAKIRDSTDSGSSGNRPNGQPTWNGNRGGRHSRGNRNGSHQQDFANKYNKQDSDKSDSNSSTSSQQQKSNAQSSPSSSSSESQSTPSQQANRGRPPHRGGFAQRGGHGSGNSFQRANQQSRNENKPHVAALSNNNRDDDSSNVDETSSQSDPSPADKKKEPPDKPDSVSFMSSLISPALDAPASTASLFDTVSDTPQVVLRPPLVPTSTHLSDPAIPESVSTLASAATVLHPRFGYVRSWHAPVSGGQSASPRDEYAKTLLVHSAPTTASALFSSPFSAETLKSLWRAHNGKSGDRFWLTALLGFDRVSCFLDIGAEENAIDERALQFINSAFTYRGLPTPTLVKATRSFALADGSPVTAIHKVELPLTFGAESITVSCWVIKNLSATVLLGSPFFKDFITNFAPGSGEITLRFTSGCEAIFNVDYGLDLIPVYARGTLRVLPDRKCSVPVRAPLFMGGGSYLVVREGPDLSFSPTCDKENQSADVPRPQRLSFGASANSTVEVYSRSGVITALQPVAYVVKESLLPKLQSFLRLLMSMSSSDSSFSVLDLPTEVAQCLSDVEKDRLRVELSQISYASRVLSAIVAKTLTDEELELASKQFDESRVSLGDERIPTDWRAKVLPVFRKYWAICQYDPDHPTVHCATEHDIEPLPDAVPYISAPNKLPANKQEVVDKELDKLTKAGLAEFVDGPLPRGVWASPVFPVHQKNKWRVVYDMRRVNWATRDDPFPIPGIDDMLRHLMRGFLFDILDMPKAYMQTLLSARAQRFCYMVTSRGFYKFFVMPWGLKNAPAEQQRMVNRVFADVPSVRVYIDDITNVTTEFSIDAYIKNLTAFFEACRKYNIRLSLDKCRWMKTRASIFRFDVEHGKYSVRLDDLRCILDAPAPTRLDQLRTWLGFTAYYRHFIPRCNDVLEPLFRLYRKDTPWSWGEEQQRAFDSIKRILTTKPVLVSPDFNEKFYIAVDASHYAIGGCASQLRDSWEHPVEFWSVSLTPEQRRWSPTKREAYALLRALRHWSPYLRGDIRHVVYTDHRPLLGLFKSYKSQDVLHRWAVEISTYPVDIIHRPGAQHGNADGPSREPIATKIDYDPSDTTVEFGSIRLIAVDKKELEEIKAAFPANLAPRNATASMSPLAVKLPCVPFDVHANLGVDDLVDHAGVSIDEWDELLREHNENAAHDDLIDITQVQPLLERKDSDKTLSDDEVRRIIGEHHEKAVRIRDKHFPTYDGSFPLPPGDLARLQCEDSDISRVIAYLQESNAVKPSDFSSQTERALFDEIANLSLNNGVLEHAFALDKSKYIRVVVPRVLRRSVLSAFHSSFLAAHINANSAYSAARQKWWWPGMRSDFKLWVQLCSACALVKRKPMRARAIHHVDHAVMPLDVVSLDHVTMPVTSTNGNKFLLTLIDHATRRAFAYACPDLTARVFTDCVNKFRREAGGYPVVVIMDHGSTMTSSAAISFFQHLGIKVNFTSVGRAEPNGLDERLNRTLVELINTAASERNCVDSWDELLDDVVLAYNLTPQSSTGVAPLKAWCGWTPNHVIDNILLPDYTFGQDLAVSDPGIVNAINMSHALSVARRNLQDARAAQRAKANKNPDKVPRFKQGDVVQFLEDREHKLQPHYSGPWVVSLPLANDTYVIANAVSPPKVAHVSRLYRPKRPTAPQDYGEYSRAVQRLQSVLERSRVPTLPELNFDKWMKSKEGGKPTATSSSSQSESSQVASPSPTESGSTTITAPSANHQDAAKTTDAAETPISQHNDHPLVPPGTESLFANLRTRLDNLPLNESKLRHLKTTLNTDYDQVTVFGNVRLKDKFLASVAKCKSIAHVRLLLQLWIEHFSEIMLENVDPFEMFKSKIMAQSREGGV